MVGAYLARLFWFMKKLRSGYTTGACAAAAAKGAALRMFGNRDVEEVEIPFPDGRRVCFTLKSFTPEVRNNNKIYAAVIKDAGDDPDVTNGALVAASIELNNQADGSDSIEITGGEGVGIVTKPGLAVAIGKPAINPVPLQMIRAAVKEAIAECGQPLSLSLIVEILVPAGKELAEKTLNERLGIVGGISILGTTGIVRPISAEAWTATITAAMDVAQAGGNEEIVLSTGRTSEKALQGNKNFKPEAFIMMGDYLEFSLKEARNYHFSRLHMAGMWAKILKAALKIPQTHVRFGALEIQHARQCIEQLAPDKDLSFLNGANTAREIYERLIAKDCFELVEKVCYAAKEYHEHVSETPVTVYLVHHDGSIKVTTAG